MTGGFLKNLSYIFFPRRCVLCGEVVLPDEELCEPCAEYIQSAALNTSAGEMACKASAVNDVARVLPLAPFAYAGAVRNALRRLKFNGELSSAPFFAERMAQSLQCAADGFDAVCFIPLHGARQKSRGYNQSEVLARLLARELGLPLRSELLVRLRDTPSQREFDRAGRQDNVRGAFALADGAAADALRLLLIDDITTTGATLRECAGVLIAAGAAEVLCAAAAATSLSQEKSK
ncbi:MAG: double zinc ribbon domain-containing protein [Oscillospiraceae bacterium]|jgi:ComF family protein|nr:double zinc ribbon domain-containing protein [Oscillospiraceae bacterium]